jgi:hypothetical protein
MVIGESGDALKSGVCRSRVRDGCIFARHPSTSPVAPEWTIDDDSNGSMARDRFNLVVHD